MESEARCEFCSGPLTEDEAECPWCGREPGSVVEEEDRPKVSPVLMIVVIFLMVVIVSYLMMDLSSHPPYADTSIALSTPEMTDRIVDEQVLWTANLVTLKVTPKDEPVPFSRLSVTIIEPDGLVLHKDLKLRRYDLSKLDDSSDGTIDIQAWYINEDKDRNNIGNPDIIRITGLTEDYRSCRIDVKIDDNRVGSTQLPDDFVD